MKKLVIIGANNFQRPLIQKARTLGLETHVFAWEKGAVGREFADHFYPISIIEKNRILEEARRIEPDGVLSIGSDLAIITVNYLAKQLGLIGNSPECTRVTTDKLAMRLRLSQCGLPCPRFSDASDVAKILNDCGDFPLIVKPLDRSGSRGVTLARSAGELGRAIERAQEQSFQHRHIVEEFVTGREYSVEMISWQGEHYFLQVTEKETSGAPFFVEKAHHQPADLPEPMIEKIIDIVRKSLNCLGVEFGASHSEVLLTDDDEVFIVEIGARMGGDYIGSHLVELSTGYDFVRGAIYVALGRFGAVVKTKKLYSGIHYVFAKQGILKSVENRCYEYPEIVFNEVYFHVGGETRDARESNDRAACYVYQCESGKHVSPEELIVLK